MDSLCIGDLSFGEIARTKKIDSYRVWLTNKGQAWHFVIQRTDGDDGQPNVFHMCADRDVDGRTARQDATTMFDLTNDGDDVVKMIAILSKNARRS